MKSYRFAVALILMVLVIPGWTSIAAGQILWMHDGAPVCDVPDLQAGPKIVADGMGGAVIVWEDTRNLMGRDIYAQRINADGDTLWPAGGVPISIEYLDQSAIQIVTDDSSGAIIAWMDERNFNDDIYIQRVDSDGDTLWWGHGVPVIDDTMDQSSPQMIADGEGGVIIVWEDLRDFFSWDIYAQRFNANGISQWTYQGEAVCTDSFSQVYPVIAADGSGGAIIAWQDYRGGNTDIYAQRIDADGDTLWPADGTAVCNYGEAQSNPQIVADPEGAFIVWTDHRNGSYDDIYAQRVDPEGARLWSTYGYAICTAEGNQTLPQIINDGQGGAIIAWTDSRSGTDWDIYAQRVDANGNMLWSSNGAPICTAPKDQWAMQLVNDGSGGAIITWQDYRTDRKYDIYAQRVDADGNTLMPADGIPLCTALNNQSNPCIASAGDFPEVIVAWEDNRLSFSEWDIYTQKVNFDPPPRISSAADVPGDQGRQVAIQWDRSYLDDAQFQGITEYSIWRRYPSGIKDGSRGHPWAGRLPRPEDRGVLVYRLVERKLPDGGTVKESWQFIDTIDAHYLGNYTFFAPTLADSSGAGTPYFTFMVSAHTADPHIFYDSAPDSGYSVDNVGPAPTVLSLAQGTKDGARGSLQLSWEQVTAGTDGSPETGPILYHLYGDTAAFFTPAPGNLLTTTQDLTYAHSDGRIGDPAANLFYQIVVTDGSGNESEGSNRTGEYDWDLAATTGTDYAWMALALDDTALAMASDLESAIEAHSSPATNCLTVSQWNPTAQTYTHYTTVPIPMGDFALMPGLPCRVEVTAGAVFTLTGGVPAAGSLSFQLHATTGTDYTWLSLPLELSALTMASDLEAHIEAHSDPATDCLTISQWNPTAQAYTHYTTVPVPMGDFAIAPGRPYRVEVTAGAVWPYAGKGLKEFQRVLHTR